MGLSASGEKGSTLYMIGIRNFYRPLLYRKTFLLGKNHNIEGYSIFSSRFELLYVLVCRFAQVKKGINLSQVENKKAGFARFQGFLGPKRADRATSRVPYCNELNLVCRHRRLLS